MSKKVRHIKFPSSIRALLRTVPMAVSPAICQAILNVRDDDGLLLKALKRRLALPPVKTDHMERVAISQDERIDFYLSDLTARTQLSTEEIIRLAVEAYLFKL